MGDLRRGFSRPMGEDEGEGHCGLSGYGVRERGDLAEALLALDERMGIRAAYVDQRGRTARMYVAVYRGSHCGSGPDGEELFNPIDLLAKIDTRRLKGDIRAAIATIGRSVWTQLSDSERELVLPEDDEEKAAAIAAWGART